MYKILGNGVPVIYTALTLYTVPAGKMTAVSLISAAMQDGSVSAPATGSYMAQIHIVPAGDSASLDNLLQKRQITKLSDRYDFTGVVMNEGDSIVVKSQLPNMNFMAFGDEKDNTLDDKYIDVLTAIKGAVYGGKVHTDTVVNVNCNCA